MCIKFKRVVLVGERGMEEVVEGQRRGGLKVSTCVERTQEMLENESSANWTS